MKKTKQETVIGNVQIWAVPRSQYYMDENPNAIPFRYELSTSRMWATGAVKVHEDDIAMVVPEGIDLLTKAVDTMKEEIAVTRADAQKKVEEIQERINSLLLLEYQPTTEEV